MKNFSLLTDKILGKICLEIPFILKNIIQLNKKRYNTNNKSIDIFDCLNPSISLDRYFIRLFSKCNIDVPTVIHSLILIDRFYESKLIIMTHKNIYKVFLSALLIAIKFNYDDSFKEITYSIISGIPQFEMAHLEKFFLEIINYKIVISLELYYKYLDSILK